MIDHVAVARVHVLGYFYAVTVEKVWGGMGEKL